MDKQNKLDVDTRRIIYYYIQKHPGLHLREISRKLNLKVFNLKYHINILNKNGYIIQKKEDGFLRLFATHTVSNGDKKQFFYLRQKTTRNIILIILYNIAASQREICESLEKSPSTINFHINKLLKNKVIELVPHNKGIINRLIKPRILEKDLTGREIVFRLTDPFTIYRLLNEYKDTLLDEETKVILDAINYSIEIGMTKLKFGVYGTSSYDQHIEYLFEILPHPYHA